jgi:predicted transposase YbfD/YdcC
VFRKRQLNNQERMEVSFFNSSCQPKVRTLAEHIWEHWSIENSQHYVLDVTFAEDACRVRRGTSPEISGSIRRVALNILQGDRRSKTTFAANVSVKGGMATISKDFGPLFQGPDMRVPCLYTPPLIISSFMQNVCQTLKIWY